MFPLYEIIQNMACLLSFTAVKPTGSETTYSLDRCVFRPLETTQCIAL
jgi:hypothetical protein